MILANPVQADPPIQLREIEDVTVDEDPGRVDIVDLDNIFADPDGRQIEFRFAGAPEDLNMGISRDNILFFNPTLNFNIERGAEITVVGMNARGEANETQFVLTINPVNDAPRRINPIDDIIVNEDPGRVDIADLDDVFFDVDGDALTYSFVSDVPELNVVIDDNNVLFFDPDLDFNIAGGVDVTVTSEDADEETASDIVHITVRPINDAPEIIGAIDDIIIDEDADRIDIVDLTTIFSDVEDDQLEYRIIGAPAEANLGIDNVVLFLDPDRDFNLENGVEITIVASDDEGEVVQESFVLIIRPVNDPPEVVNPIDDVEVEQDAGWIGIADLDEVFFDVDGDVLDYRLINDVEELNLQITNNNFLFFDSEEDFVLPEGAEITVVAEDNGGLTVEDTFILTIIPGLEPHFEFRVTGDDCSILINSATLNGEMLEISDEIGVFTPAGLCAGAIVIGADDPDQPFPAAIAAWGDDPRTEEIDGLRNGEQFSFRYWDFENETEIEAEIDEIIVGGDEWRADGFNVLTIVAEVEPEVVEQVIELNQGWNMISLNIIPVEEFWQREEGPDVILLMDQIEDQLGILKDENGRFYIPEWRFNNIPFWDLQEAYQISLNEAVVLRIDGFPFPPDMEMQLNRGWNLLAYTPDYELDASAPEFYVLSPIIDNVVIAKNGAGQFLNPEFRFSNMPPWRPGQGYQVNVDDDVAFVYPPEREEELAFAGLTPIKGKGGTTGTNMSLLLNNISGNVKPGDRIIVLNSENIVISEGIIDRDGRCGLAIWGDDECTETIDGLRDDEEFRLVLSTDDGTLEIQVIEILIGSGLVYRTDEFTVLNVSGQPPLPEEYYLSTAYPNPFNSSTRISYGLSDNSKVSVRIYDIAGGLVETLISEDQSSGHYSVTWETNATATGVYLIQIEAGQFNRVTKAVLTR